MEYDLVIRGRRFVISGVVVRADIAMWRGQIAAIGSGFGGAKELDAGGLIRTPDEGHRIKRDALGTRSADLTGLAS
jgi:hypothetical protein